MTHSIAVTQCVLAVVQPGVDYSTDDIRRLLAGQCITSAQLRNALCALSQSQRLLRTGGHTHGRYRLNEYPPKVRTGGATSPHAAQLTGHGDRSTNAGTGFPAWSAPRRCRRLDTNPVWRIAL